MTQDEALATIEKAGIVEPHNAQLMGFEPETKPCDLRHRADVLLLATVLITNRGCVETYLVRSADGTVAAWVRTSRFWTPE